MSYTLAQAFYLLSRNPDVQDEIRARIPEVGDFQTSVLRVREMPSR